MSSGGRVYHQDYIARIRYSNALPPPPNPPKLLDVPGTGLEAGTYTSAAFATRMVRERPLNIEADAELGMPIDLIGLPGVFDGDDRAMMARENIPPLDPADRALLRPLASLGKSNGATSGVSFLRRTEYISSTQGAQRFESSTSKDLLRMRNTDAKRKRRAAVVNQDDPINIIRHLVKGFDLAYPHDAYRGPDSQTDIRGADVTDAERKAWSKPTHPTRPELRLVESYPLLPDFDALPSDGSYQVVKFTTNPIVNSDDYDPRLDVAILRPLGVDADKMEEKLAAHKLDPSLPPPLEEWEYGLYLADQGSDPSHLDVSAGLERARDLKRKLAAANIDANDEADGIVLRYARDYETYKQAGDAEDPYGDAIALALYDGGDDSRQKAAYYYPVRQRATLRPKRKPKGPVAQKSGEWVEHADLLVVSVQDAGADEVEYKRSQLAKLDPSVQTETEVKDGTREEVQA